MYKMKKKSKIGTFEGFSFQPTSFVQQGNFPFYKLKKEKEVFILYDEY